MTAPIEMPELAIYPVVGLGNYGSNWEATLKTGDDAYNKVESVKVNTPDMIFVKVQSQLQSFKFAQRSSGATAIESVAIRLNCSSDAVGSRVKVRVILPSSSAWQEITIYPPATLAIVEFELANAPDGLGWTLAKFNELQVITFSYLIVNEQNLNIESIEAWVHEAI